MHPRSRLRALPSVALALALAGCGDSGSSVDAGARPQGTPGSPESVPRDSPAVQAGRLIEVQYADAFALWKARLGEDRGGAVETSWTASETGEAEWRATGTVENAKGLRKTGTWTLALPLDREPTTAEMERADRPDAVAPADRGARELSRLPPASPPEGDLSAVATLVARDDDTFLTTITPSQATGDLLVDDGVIDEAMLRGIGVTGTTRAPVEGSADIDGSTKITSRAGAADAPRTVAALAERARQAAVLFVRLTWSGTDAEPGTIEDLLSLPVKQVEILER